MVVTYQADPHVQVAQNFPEDPMVRFMHNSHTPAPYGYGWTWLSLPFFILGIGKFIGQWVMMRAAAGLSLAITGWITWRWWKQRQLQEIPAAAPVSLAWSHPLWVYLNPLLLIEIISNDHNDLWMIWPTMLSLWLLDDQTKKRPWKILISALLLAGSTQIKFATLVLIPFWLYLAGGRELITWLKTKLTQPKNHHWLFKLRTWGEKYFYDLIALAMFAPLLTARSQYFHPWYLTWSLVWWPWCRWSGTRIALLAFSFSSLFRYLPFLWAGN